MKYFSSMSFSYVLLTICAVNLYTAQCRVMPNHFPEACRKSSPDYNQCLREYFAKIGPYMLKGIRKLNVPKFTPMKIPLITINQTTANLVAYDGIARKVKMWGFNTLEFEKIDVNPRTMEGHIRVNFPTFDGFFEYDCSVTIFGFSITNIGYYRGNFTNSILDFNFKLRAVEKSGTQYYEFEKFRVDSTMKKGDMTLVSDDPQQQTALNVLRNFFYDDTPLFMEMIAPILDNVLTAAYRAVFEQILQRVPAQELLPE